MQQRSSEDPQKIDTGQVIHEVVEALVKLGYLEAIQGFVTEDGCQIVAVGNRLSEKERYGVWDVKWDFLAKYAEIDIDIRLLQRRDQPMSRLFADDESAYISMRLASISQLRCLRKAIMKASVTIHSPLKYKTRSASFVTSTVT